MSRFVFIVAVATLTLFPAAARAQDAGAPVRDEPPRDAREVGQDEGAAVLEEIRAAIAQGNVTRLMERSGERLDLTIFGTAELLSRSQAHYVVRSFFGAYPPTRVEFVDMSESNDNWFASADYSYETGTAPLSVYLRLRRGAAGWELRELRFDRSANR